MSLGSSVSTVTDYRLEKWGSLNCMSTSHKS